MKYFAFILSVLFFNNLLYSQDFEEYYKQRQNEFESYYNEKEDDYKKYIADRDKEFSEHLKKNWESFKMMEKKFYESKPKPLNMPVYIDSLEKKFNVIEYNLPKTDTVSYQPSIKKIVPHESFSFYKKVTTSFSFYDENIIIEHEDISVIEPPFTYNNKIISENWDKLNKLEFYNCIPQLLKYKETYRLNDWGYYLLVREFAKKLKNNNQYYKLLLWYLMVKSDYMVKIGYTEINTVLLVPFNTDIYEVPYYEINQDVYYVFESENPGSIKTYIQHYPGAMRNIQPEILNPPVFKMNVNKKTIEHFYKGELQQVTVDVSQQLTGFYKDYPLMNLETYFKSGMSDLTKNSLYESVSGKILNKTEKEAAGYLLTFSQNGFKYMTDIEQFGAEKIFFPDEMFLYKYSDCEDRAVFFAYIVKEFLDLEVIGLDYSDHVAVAVHFNDNVDGNYLVWKNKKYIICDPTFVNAPIGKTLPKLLQSKPNLIDVKN